MMAHTFNPATKEVEAGGCLWLWDTVSYSVGFCLKENGFQNVFFYKFSYIRSNESQGNTSLVYKAELCEQSQNEMK